MAKLKRYETYLKERFNKEYFYMQPKTIETNPVNSKPMNAIWGSSANPTADEFTWTQWCTQEDFYDYPPQTQVIWHLKRGTRVFQLHTEQDAQEMLAKYGMPSNPTSPYLPKKVNFEKMSKDYDAIDFKVQQLYWTMYGWDCDCICVLNKDRIVIDSEVEQ